jgi:hypothetical protein
MKNYKKSLSNFFTYKLGYLAFIAIVGSIFGLTLILTPHPIIALIPLVLAFIPILFDAVKDLFAKKITTELFLIFATGVGLIAREELAITVVLLIMHIAKYTEGFIKEKTGNAIESLIRLVPTNVIAIINGQDQRLALNQVKPKMRLVIKTGEQIPVDGIIIEGHASINESFLTGESIPLEKGIKDPFWKNQSSPRAGRKRKSPYRFNFKSCSSNHRSGAHCLYRHCLVDNKKFITCCNTACFWLAYRTDACHAACHLGGNSGSSTIRHLDQGRYRFGAFFRN